MQETAIGKILIMQMFLEAQQAVSVFSHISLQGILRIPLPFGAYYGFEILKRMCTGEEATSTTANKSLLLK